MTGWFGVTTLVMAIIFFIYRAYKIKKESNKILKEKNIAIQKQNVEITHQKEEILAQREQLELINKEIEKQNENIKASIYYANTIQQAILPSEEEIKEYFDAFSIYLPKDIVSGDFFWFARDKESVNHSDLFFIAVADCTGHGVPGGFLSMVGSRMLNVVINENKIHSPEEVLDRVDQGFQKALRQEQTENDDGMDIVLVCIERKKNNKGEYIDPVHVRFSGARRPLLILKHGSSVEMIKGDRKTIGGRFHTEQVFTRKDVTLNKGDKLYLTSDGITDQHSPDREKFGLNRLMQILSENGALTMDEQKTNLEERLLSFMKYEKQRDDITLLGIKL